jgi:hypothetical protein
MGLTRIFLMVFHKTDMFLVHLFRQETRYIASMVILKGLSQGIIGVGMGQTKNGKSPIGLLPSCLMKFQRFTSLR